MVEAQYTVLRKGKNDKIRKYIKEQEQMSVSWVITESMFEGILRSQVKSSWFM